MKIFLTGVHNKLRRYSWPSKYIDKELESFLRLINEVPQLSSDATMINFLRNHNVDFADTRFVISGIVHSQCMQFETSSCECPTPLPSLDCFIIPTPSIPKGMLLAFRIPGFVLSRILPSFDSFYPLQTSPPFLC